MSKHCLWENYVEILYKRGSEILPQKHDERWDVMRSCTGCDRVAMAQGKQGIWLLTFPDRENTGNLVNLIFYTGKIVATWGKF